LIEYLLIYSFKQQSEFDAKHHSAIDACKLFSRSLCLMAKRYILYSKSVRRSEQDTTVQLSTPYTDRESHNEQRHRQMDGHTTDCVNITIG